MATLGSMRREEEEEFFDEQMTIEGRIQALEGIGATQVLPDWPGLRNLQLINISSNTNDAVN